MVLKCCYALDKETSKSIFLTIYLLGVCNQKFMTVSKNLQLSYKNLDIENIKGRDSKIIKGGDLEVLVYT